MYVVLALPSGRWLDARFERALSAGAVLTAGGGLLRLAGPESFAWALAGQLVVAAGQPLVLNSITKVAARYFPEQERTAAIAAGTASLYVGILAAVLSGGPLFDAGGLRLLVSVQAAVAVVAAAWVLVAVRTPAAFRGDPSVAVSLRWLWGDRFLWVLAGLLFVGMGVFNAVATWLDSILGHFGRGSAAGYLIAIMTVAGILGAAVVPQAVARHDQRRALLQVTVGVTIVSFALIAALHSVGFVAVALAVEGFVLLAALPVVPGWPCRPGCPPRRTIRNEKGPDSAARRADRRPGPAVEAVPGRAAGLSAAPRGRRAPGRGGRADRAPRRGRGGAVARRVRLRRRLPRRPRARRVPEPRVRGAVTEQPAAPRPVAERHEVRGGDRLDDRGHARGAARGPRRPGGRHDLLRREREHPAGDEDLPGLRPGPP